MPIVDPDDMVALVEKPNTVRIAAPEFKNVVVDTRYTPAQSLITNIEGSSWTVNYYSQVLDEDSAVIGQNVTLNPIYQQYKLIRNFELKVTSPLQASQEDSSKSFSYTGSANVYPSIIVNVGDMFVADIGDGKAGVFKITSSERKSIFKDTAHYVEYLLIDYADSGRQLDLDTKVVQTYEFVKDFMMHGQNPMVVEEDFSNIADLKNWYHDLISKYFKWFSSNEFKVLMLPGQTAPTYDPYAVKAITSFFDTREAPQLRFLRVLNVDGERAMESTCIWDALIRKDHRLLRHAHKRAGLVSSRIFTKNPMLEGIYWSGIQRVVYPKDPELTVDQPLDTIPRLMLVESLVPAPTAIRSIADIFAENTLFSGLPFSSAPVIHDVTDDDYYVLSGAFYNKATTGQSKLELAVWRYLNNEAIDLRVLLAMASTCHAWGALERFYYIPILLILIRAHIRGI